MLRFLGRLGKGWATWSGIAVVVAGMVTGASSEVTGAVTNVSEHVPVILAAVGSILAGFGIGRKARDAARNAPHR